METVALVAIAVVAVGFVMVDLALGRRTAVFAERFPSFESFAAAVDAERVRAVKRAAGEVAAIRAVRVDVPDAPLDDVVRLVRRL
jgi:hypothetical protein